MAINNTTCQNFTSPTTGIEYNVADGSTDPTTDVINPKRQDGLWVSKKWKKIWAESTAVEKKESSSNMRRQRPRHRRKQKGVSKTRNALKSPRWVQIKKVAVDPELSSSNLTACDFRLQSMGRKRMPLLSWMLFLLIIILSLLQNRQLLLPPSSKHRVTRLLSRRFCNSQLLSQAFPLI